jgi:hypothetical protein
LYGTWQKQHPEQEEARTESYRWQQNRQEEAILQKPSRSSQSDDDDAYLRLLRIKEAAERKNAEKPAVPTPVKQTEPVTYEPTQGERERETAIWLALNAIKRFVKSPFRTEFSPLDREDILPEGIVAKAIDMGENAGSSFDEDSLKKAALELLDSFECSAERAGDAAEAMLDVVANLALPETQPSLGGGQSNNDLPKKKDEEWYWWKKNGFIRQQNYRGRRR